MVINIFYGNFGLCIDGYEICLVVVVGNILCIIMVQGVFVVVQGIEVGICGDIGVCFLQELYWVIGGVEW